MVEESYQDFLGLTRNPFAAPRKGFFGGSNRQQLLDQLRHLSQWSSRVLLVTGVRGSGKTSLFRALADNLETRAIPIRIQGALTSDAREVMVAIAHGLGLDHPVDANIPLLRDLVQRHIAELADTDRFSVLMVDDAHLLEPKAREQLLALQSAVKARVVLFGEPRFVGGVVDIARRSNLQWHEAKLRSFTSQEVREYIEWRITQVKGAGIGPFTDDEVAEISRHSEGRPAVIDVLGEDILNGRAMGDAPSKPGIFPMSHRLLAGLLVLVIGMAYLVVKRLEQPDSLVISEVTGAHDLQISHTDAPTGSDTLHLLSQPGIPADVELTPAPQPEAVATDTETNRAINGAANDAAALIAPESKRSSVQTAAPVAKPTEVKAAPVSSASDRDVASSGNGSPIPVPQRNAPVMRPAAKVATAQRTPVARSPEPVPAAAQADAPSRPMGLAGARSARWLLQQEPEAYVIQLLTLSSEQRLDDFLERQQRPEDFATYRLQRDGRTYHIVVYGFYKDRSRAEAAARKLPNTVGQLKPWIRPLAPIQQAIRGALQR